MLSGSNTNSGSCGYATALGMKTSSTSGRACYKKVVELNYPWPDGNAAGAYGSVTPKLIPDTTNDAQPTYTFHLWDQSNNGLTNRNIELPDEFTFKIKSTFTNGVVHLSQEIKFTVWCKNDYTIVATTTVQTIQLVEHGNNLVGFVLPVYESRKYDGTTPNIGCPVYSWAKSTTTGTFNDHTGLIGGGSPYGGPSPLTSTAVAFGVSNNVGYGAFEDAPNGNKIIKPANNALHQGYDFYMQVKAMRTNSLEGTADTIVYFPLYTVKVGCYHDSIVTTDDPALVTSFTWLIDSSGAGVWTHAQPTSNLAYCVREQNLITYENGQIWTDCPLGSSDQLAGTCQSQKLVESGTVYGHI